MQLKFCFSLNLNSLNGAFSTKHCGKHSSRNSVLSSWSSDPLQCQSACWSNSGPGAEFWSATKHAHGRMCDVIFQRHGLCNALSAKNLGIGVSTAAYHSGDIEHEQVGNRHMAHSCCWRAGWLSSGSPIVACWELKRSTEKAAFLASLHAKGVLTLHCGWQTHRVGSPRLTGLIDVSQLQ